MGLEDGYPVIGFIGGGPRAAGIIERIVANAGVAPAGRGLEIVTFDPHPAGPGRIWRYDQSPSLRMNSLAEDVAIFADETCQIAGPLVTGPTLAEWIDLVRRGDIPFVAPDDQVAAEIRTLGPKGFATRRLFSCYLRWYYLYVRSLAPRSISIEDVTGTVVEVRETDDRHVVTYVGPDGVRRSREIDIVVYTVGHTDSEPTREEVVTLERSARHGLAYWPSHYASDADLDAVPPGEPLLVRGLGLSFIDTVVRLTLDRGGIQTYDPDAPAGSRSTYSPSGREPRIVAGSRRGVPYHAKITSHLHGEQPGYATTFLTRDALKSLLDGQAEVDFTRDVWPTIVREMAYWHYREIFTGHPERVAGSWAAFSELFREERLDSPRMLQAIAEAVRPDDVFDIDALDHPLRGVRSTTLDGLQGHLADYIRQDIHLRESEEHSETLAVFFAVLACYGVVAESVGHPSWSLASRLEAIPRRWHEFFSYLDSGPPPIRLELLLALMRAGLLTFLGGGMRVDIDDEAGTFIATSDHQPEAVRARHLLDAFHPKRAIAQSIDPVLRDLIAERAGREQMLPAPDGPVATGRLQVDFVNGNVIRPDGSSHERRFAVGDFTSGPPSAAFSRPRTNARTFRENDSIARRLLETAARLPAHEAEPSLAH